MAAAADLLVRVKGDTSDVNSKLGALGSGLGKLGRLAAGAALAGGVAVAALGVKGVLAFSGFEKGMKEVFTLLPDISGKAMGEMEDQVLDLSRKMGVLPDEVVPALYQAISAGVPKENVFDFMELASMAAIGGVTDLETAVDGITSTVNAFGSEVITAAEASDLMLTSVRLGKTTFEELSKSLFQVNPVAAGLGVEFGNVTASLAALTSQGVPTSVAATQIRGALVELGKEGTAASDTFKELAGKSFVEFIAAGGDMKDAFDLMAAGADDMGVGVGDLFGSVEAGMAVIALTSEAGSAKFGESMDAMADASGATQAAFETMDSGLSRSWDRVKASVSTALIGIGEKLAPMVQKFADAFQEKLPAMIAAAQELFANIANFVTNNVVPAFQVLSAWWAANGPKIVTAISEVADTVRTFVEDTLAKLSAWWAENGPQIIATVESISEAIRTFVEATLGRLSAWWEENGPMIVAAVGEMGEAIRTFVDETLERLSAWWEEHGPQVLAVIESIRSGIESAFNFMVEKILWAIENWDKVKVAMQVLATFIAAVMIPHYVMVAVAAVVSAAKQVAAWVSTQVAAIVSVTAASVAIVTFVAKWAWLGLKALFHAAQIVTAWVLTHVGALASVAIGVGAMVVLGAKWVWLGVTSLLAGAKIALAWLLALGPIGLLIAAVAVAVGLIIANWDTIKAAALSFKDWIVEKFGAVVDFFKALPDTIKSFLTDVIEAAKSLGAGLISGILSGIGGLASTLYNKLKAGIGGAIDKVKGFFRIGSPSKLMMEQIGEPLAAGITGPVRTAIDWAVNVAPTAAVAAAPETAAAPTTIILQVGDAEMGRWVLDLAGLDRQTVRTT